LISLWKKAFHGHSKTPLESLLLGDAPAAGKSSLKPKSATPQ
jgi:hypothetical protein